MNTHMHTYTHDLIGTFCLPCGAGRSATKWDWGLNLWRNFQNNTLTFTHSRTLLLVLKNRTRTFINNALNSCPWLQLIMVSSDIQLIISISYSAKTWMKRDTLCMFYIKQNVDLWKFRQKAKDVCTIITYVCFRNLTYAIDCLNPQTFRDIISGALIKADELWCISVINYNNVHIMIRIGMIMMVMMMFISRPRSD